MGILDKIKKEKKKEDVQKSEPKVSGTKKKEVSAKKEVTGRDLSQQEGKEPKKTESKTPSKVAKVISKTAAVLVRPLVSEKAALSEAGGVYTFVIKNSANKVQVKQAVKEVYGVEPKAVRVMNFEGKRHQFGRRRGKRNDWKKAVVTLPKGKTINIHEGV